MDARVPQNSGDKRAPQTYFTSLSPMLFISLSFISSLLGCLQQMLQWVTHTQSGLQNTQKGSPTGDGNRRRNLGSMEAVPQKCSRSCTPEMAWTNARNRNSNRRMKSRASERAAVTAVGGELATTASGSDDEIQMYVPPDSPFSVFSSLVSSKHSTTRSHIPLSDLTASMPWTSAPKSSPRLVLVDAAQLRVMEVAVVLPLHKKHSMETRIN
jgi:hypothetical protein